MPLAVGASNNRKVKILNRIVLENLQQVGNYEKLLGTIFPLFAPINLKTNQIFQFGKTVVRI